MIACIPSGTMRYGIGVFRSWIGYYLEPALPQLQAYPLHGSRLYVKSQTGITRYPET
jgi:hypothetical protein